MTPAFAPAWSWRPQTFGSSVNVHPHVHAIASRGGWTKQGTWVPIPYLDSGAAARLFRHKVLRLLLDAGRIDEERVELILGWRLREGSRFTTRSETSKLKPRARLAAYILWLPPSPIRPNERQLRKRWAALIRRVYEVDPLLCMCGATMRIVAIITPEERHHKDPRAHEESGRSNRNVRDRAPTLPATRPPGRRPIPDVN